MELKQIKELMAAMERAGIKKLSVKETTGFELQLERHEENFASNVLASSPTYHSFTPTREVQSAHAFPSSVPHSRSTASEDQGEKKEEKASGKYVTSPMVGTFYSTPSPDDNDFVKVGDRVDENTVVCIIEAMKVMNEVKAGMSGVVAEVCVENAHPVEFATKLFRIV